MPRARRIARIRDPIKGIITREEYQNVRRKPTPETTASPRPIAKGTMPPANKRPPMAAPDSQWRLLQAVARQLGIEWRQLTSEAGLSKASHYRSVDGSVSQKTYQQIESALREVAVRRGTVPLLDLVTEWAQLGVELAMVDAPIMRKMIGDVRALLAGYAAQARLRGGEAQI